MLNQSRVRRGALAGVIVGASILLGGCAANQQQIIQTVVGLLGAALGQGGLTGTGTGGPLQGPIAGLLPQAPGQTPGLGTAPLGGFGAAPAPAGVAPAGGTANALGNAIRQAAYNLPDPFPYKAGTNNGRLGCADVVSHALAEAGAIDRSEHNLAVAGVNSLLRGKGWTDTNQPYKDGDVIIWEKVGSNKHIGIIVIENGETYAIHNSSSQRRPIKMLLSSYNRGIETVLRNPGA